MDNIIHIIGDYLVAVVKELWPNLEWSFTIINDDLDGVCLKLCGGNYLFRVYSFADDLIISLAGLSGAFKVCIDDHDSVVNAFLDRANRHNAL
jgi:hypothetical protein